MEHEKHPHYGHRERVRQTYVQNGLDGIPAHNVLEYLLFHTIPRRDVNPLAHALIEHFGSLSNVLDASYDELRRIPGMNDISAAFLSLLPSVFRRYQEDKCNTGVTFHSIEDIGDYLFHLFAGRKVETMIVLCLDLKNKLISSRVLATGSVEHVSLPVRQIVETALSLQAVGIVIGHNHPNGLALPSSRDISATRHLRDVLAPLGIELIDHIVANESDYTSMRQSGILAHDG